jgi:archaellum component FlaC
MTNDFQKNSRNRLLSIFGAALRCPPTSGTFVRRFSLYETPHSSHNSPALNFMAKILLIISALVIAATAYLGFAAKQKVDAIQGELASKKKTLLATQADLSKTKSTLKKTEDELVAAKADIEVKEKDIAAKKIEIEGLGTKLAETTKNLETAQAELKVLTENPTNPGEKVNVDQLRADIDELKRSKAETESKLAETIQVKDTLTKQLGEERSKTAAANTVVESYKKEYTKPGVTGTILAYNPGWNFVVLSIGDKQSLKAGKELVVTRGGQMVGKVRVTSVEPSTSIADVLPSTVAKGDSVQPGDRVVYETRTK